MLDKDFLNRIHTHTHTHAHTQIINHFFIKRNTIMITEIHRVEENIINKEMIPNNHRTTTNQ